VSLLGKLHVLAKLPRPQDEDARVKVALRDAAKATALRVPEVLPEQKEALSREDFNKLEAACLADPVHWLAIRDRAMILCAYAGGGRRRSELASMTFERVKLTDGELPDGRVERAYRWSLPNMKKREATTAAGEVLATLLVGDAVDALEAWLEVLRSEGIRSGRIWRRVYRSRRRVEATSVDDAPEWIVGAPLKDEALLDIVQQRAREAGLEASKLGAHSLRATFATDMLSAGVGELAVMQMTGHRSVASLAPYDRRDIVANPALAVLANRKR
jgi:integrase